VGHDPEFCQFAVSVGDPQRMLGWYRGVFGFLAAGSRPIGGADLAGIQGLPPDPATKAHIYWLLDQQDAFQLELFAYEKPAPRPRRSDAARNDVGYTTIGFHVDDFDAALARAVAHGSPPLTPPLGVAGARRACIRDPEGGLVEVMEDDPRSSNPLERRVRSDVPVVVRYITASVPDLDRARRFWVDVVGLRPGAEDDLHRREHESLWGLARAARRSLVLWGGDVALELVEYQRPRGRSRPAGYRISDLGFVNVAVGGHDAHVYEAVKARTRAAAYNHNLERAADDVRAVYVDDDQGFSLELLFRSRETSDSAGFVPVVDA
jgi:catechol 2,3-dioxygenase-like lactoylglutathione lyase family enzyme